MEYLKYALWAVGAFFLVVGADEGKAGAIVFGFLLIIAGFLSQIKKSISDFSSSKAQADLLKLKELLDKGVLTQSEFDEKAKKLKEKI